MSARAFAAALLWVASVPALAHPHDSVQLESVGDDSLPRRTWNALRHALANNDNPALQAVLADDAEIVDIDASGTVLRARGSEATAALLQQDAGADAGVGVALLPTRTFRVDDVVYAAETLPRVAGAPARLSIYRTYEGRVLRIWRFPVVAATAASALGEVIAYREAWSSGHWDEVALHHAPDVRFLRLGGRTLAELSSVAARRQCYEVGFRRWRARSVGAAYHPQVDGCDGGPITIERGVAVGPYVATVEKRMWASAVNAWSLRMFLYVADATGVRRVIYVFAW